VYLRRTLRQFGILATCLPFIFTVALWWRANAGESRLGRNDYIEWRTRAGARYHVRANPDAIVFFRFGPQHFDLRIPFWILVSGLALTQSWWLRSLILHLRGMLRVSRGQCRRCGYDVRASPERCPECGTIIPEKILS
jgi:hypothetical protein